MAILEEAVREENMGETEEELEELEEVKEAENAQTLVVEAYGGGLDHQTLLRYDVMAHHIAHGIADKKIAQAEATVAAQWDPLHEQHREDWTALAGLQNIKGHVIAPILQRKTQEAHHALEDRATDMLRDSVAGQGKSRDEIQEAFCGEISKEICGAEYHPIAVEVFGAMVAPTIKEKEPEPAPAPAQEAKAEEQMQEQEEQKEQA